MPPSYAPHQQASITSFPSTRNDENLKFALALTGSSAPHKVLIAIDEGHITPPDERNTMANKRKAKAPEPEVEELDEELEVEVEEDADEETEEKPTKSAKQEVTFGVKDLADYLSEKTGKTITTRELRTQIRRMAREENPRVKREVVPGNRTRYDWPKGLKDPEVKAIIKAVLAGELEAGKKEALEKLKEQKAAKKAKGEGGKAKGKKGKGKKATPPPEEDDDEIEEIDLDDED